ncbi:NAD(P)H-dependent flavin oxidoreductase [Agrilutibacter solisilvae]|uniref:Propionate 3-nitronate monooxygenase n=1 Tax=Agrilutibacter solisilvae TaxID=2763317 RepID=A0A975AR87_9GAMM|nr:nitronate monooxygenase [Lysobacter solisilvae]QSX77407.1 nitronate monooxygenase [Lysobacter solisilvae]
MAPTIANEATRRLGIAHPVIQGPFGGGLSTTALAAAVSNLGGLGSFGAHMLPPERLGPLADELRGLTRAPFALNLWVSDHDAGGERIDAATFEQAWPLFEPYFRELGLEQPFPPERGHPRFDEQVDALLEARPPVFSFVFGIPSPRILAECRRRDIVTVGAATTVAEALALDAAGIDLIVATGAEAGGHRPSFLESAEDSLTGTFALVQLVAPRVRVPVIAAGGISDGRGVRAAMLLGAQAAQIGTAFLVCAESGTTDAHRAALFSGQAHHTTLTRAFTGRLARGLVNRWTRELAPSFSQLPPFPVTSWFVSQLRPAAIAAGRTDLVSLWSGQIAPNLRHRTAATLMQSLLADLAGEALLPHPHPEASPA